MSSLDKKLAGEIEMLGQQAVAAGRILALSKNQTRNAALRAAAQALRERMDDIRVANDLDVKEAQDKGMKSAFIDRLLLTPERIDAMADGVAQIAGLPDPLGKVLAEWERPSGLSIKKVSVPIGVIAVIYESRPNVTADAAALCLKSGNATILRGGSDSFHSSGIILSSMQKGIAATGLPQTSIQRVGTRDRAAVGLLLKMDKMIDVIVPRGGKGLIERIQNESRVPVFSHLDGICHTYVDASADLARAVKVSVNAKMRRTGVCGATETLLVHREVAERFLTDLIPELASCGCEIRGDDSCQKIAEKAGLHVVPAVDADWGTEYLDSVLAVRVVETVQEAVDHINAHGSRHTEAILATDLAVIQVFSSQVDAGIIMENASTQFADGGEFGMGAEIGISTGKLHARGPVGIEQLTTFKYLVRGDFTVRN